MVQPNQNSLHPSKRRIIKSDEFLVKFENEKDDRHNTKALSLEEIISLGVGISERDDSADVKAKQQENAKFDIAALQKNQGT